MDHFLVTKLERARKSAQQRVCSMQGMSGMRIPETRVSTEGKGAG